MNSTTQRELSAQGAEIRRHLQIMEKLKSVKGMLRSYTYGNGECYYWSVSKLFDADVIEIAQRGEHSEIMLMIEQYGQAAPSPDWNKDRYCVLYRHDHILPDDVQNIIAERMNHEEIEAYIRYQGFGASAQEIFLKKSDHDMRMRYINSHGFVPSVQELLFENGNEEEIMLHFQRHGFCLEVEKKLVFNKSADEMKRLIEQHEFSVEGQRYFCQTASDMLFDFYINRYGFWNEAHEALVESRSVHEIKNYICRHRFLSDDGERALVHKGDRDLIVFYMENKVCRSYFNLINVLSSQNQRYMCEIMLCERMSGGCDFRAAEKAFLKNANRMDILRYLDRFKPDDSSVSVLFERGDEGLLSYYKAKHC